MDKDESVLRVECPGCGRVLWVDSASGDVIKSERSRKPKSSLDDLLLKEKQKKAAADSRFLSTAKLREAKKAEAQKRFAAVLDNLDEEPDPD